MKSPPVIVTSKDDPGRFLARVCTTPNDPKDEKWLQELLYSHPQLLPVDQFDDVYSSPIPIGREVPTKGAAGGLIDNLYVSPDGLITIVETKLWKNPEQNRTVVAQIIDYAKDLATWDCEQLEHAVLESSKKRGETENASLRQKVAASLSENDREYHEFLDSVATCLTNARFLLLIVGDEISPKTALLTKAIHGAPGLDFRLGLVEMRFYRQSPETEWLVIVVPEVVGRTVETTRGVVRITYSNEKPQVAVTVDVDGTDGATTAKKLDLDEFFHEIKKELVQPYRNGIQAWEAIGGTITFTNAMMFFEMTLAGESHRVVRCRKNQVSVVRRSYFDSWCSDGSLYDGYLEDLKPSPLVAKHARSDKKWVTYDKMSGEDLRVLLSAATHLVERITSQE